MLWFFWIWKLDKLGAFEFVTMTNSEKIKDKFDDKLKKIGHIHENVKSPNSHLNLSKWDILVDIFVSFSRICPLSFAFNFQKTTLNLLYSLWFLLYNRVLKRWTHHYSRLICCSCEACVLVLLTGLSCCSFISNQCSFWTEFSNFVTAWLFRSTKSFLLSWLCLR